MTSPSDANPSFDPDLQDGAATFEVVVADITTEEVDAIVNAANASLLGGGGVDGAIHRAAGPELLAFCRGLGGCKTGEAKISPGFRLPARYVIHTVGPVWHGGDHGEAELLASCYTRSLDLAVQHGLKTIAFPAISTGIYGYPPEQAAMIAVTTAAGHQRVAELERVVFCAFDHRTAELHVEALSRQHG
jgi:O-acetyl-ADP-ribose deacetylase (regulator of RNase III)